MASVITNTIISSSGRVINASLGLVALGFISRYLGASSYGQYALIFSLGTILQISADFGLHLTLTRSISKQKGKDNFYLSPVITLRLVFLAVSFFVGFIVIFFSPPLSHLIKGYLIAVGGLAFQSISQLFVGIFQKYGTVWKITIGDIAGRLVQLTGIIIMGAANASLGLMILFFSLSATVSAIVHRFLLPSHIKIKPSFNILAWKKTILVSWPLGLLLFFNAVYFRIDIVMLSFFKTSLEVGNYGIAYRLIESVLFFPAMFGGLLLPRLSRTWANHQHSLFLSWLNQGLGATAWSGVFVLTVLWLFPRSLINFISGPDYQLAPPLLSILSIALMAMFLGQVISIALVACHREKTLLMISASLALFNIIANAIFIPIWGASAAALTTVATEILAISWSSFVLLRIIAYRPSVKFLAQLSISVLATVISTIALPEQIPFLVQLFLSGLIYLAVNLLTKTITADRISLLLANERTH